MKKLAFTFIIFISLVSNGQSVYINSNAPDGGDGSFIAPFNEIKDVNTWKANTTYFLKRGSDFYVTSTIIFNQHNTTMEAYGVGMKPRIWTDRSIRLWSSDDKDGIKCMNPVLKNIKFESILPAACYNENPGLVNFNDCIDGMAYHVETKGGGRGISAARCEGTLILRGCYISKTDDDGTWLYQPRHVLIDSCRYDSINRGYTLDCVDMGMLKTGGDCVQMAGGEFGEDATSLTITNSVLDRTTYDYKFNIMVGSYSNNPIDWPSLYVSNTELLHAGDDGSNIYTNEVDSVVLDRVVLSGNENGLYKGYNFGTHYIITRSIFKEHRKYHIWSQVSSSDYNDATMVLKNNVFDQSGDAFAFYSYRDNVFMQNCIISNTTNNVFYSGIGTSNTDYNCYYNNGGNYKTDETHGIYTDPLFVGNDDYYLQPGSPLIDGGNEQSSAAVDKNGIVAPYNSKWDIGALEYIEEPVLKADFSVDVDSGRAPFTVNFTDQSLGTDIEKWKWDFGDGNSSNQQNPVHEYIKAGKYTITLTVTNTNNQDGELKMDYVEATLPSYLITFNDYLGTILSEQKVLEGNTAKPPQAPFRKDYEFIGWFDEYDNEVTDFTDIDSDLDVTAKYSIISASEITLEQKFMVYPTIIKDQLTIVNPYSNQHKRLTIYGIDMRKIYSKQLEEDITQIDFSSFSSGVYLIVIGGYTKKVIKP